MSIENTPEALIEEAFEDAFNKMQENYSFVTITKVGAKNFLVEVKKRNAISQREGDTGYYHMNLQQTLNQFNIRDKEAEAYRSLAGTYFGKAKAYSQANAQYEDEMKAVRLKEAGDAELLHEHGEERAEQMKKDLGY